MTEPLRRPTPLWKLPISLALFGLVLMVGGWNLSIWCPPMGERARDQESEILQIRKKSDDPEFTRRLDGVAHARRPLAQRS